MALTILVDNIVREQRTSVDLGLAVLHPTKELTAALLIVAEESLVVNQVGTGGDSLVINPVPIVLGHLLLHNNQVTGQARKSMPIGTLGHIQPFAQNTGVMTRLLRRGLAARHPLCQQRDRLLLDVVMQIVMQLPCHQLNHLIAHRRIQQTPEIVPTPILRHQRQHRCNVLRKLLCHRHHSRTKQSALTQPATHIAGKEQPLHRCHLILEKRLGEAIRDLLNAGVTERRHGKVEIQQRSTSGAIADRPILGNRDIVCAVQHRVLDTFHKVAHILLPPIILRYLGTQLSSCYCCMCSENWSGR